MMGLELWGAAPWCRTRFAARRPRASSASEPCRNRRKDISARQRDRNAVLVRAGWDMEADGPFHAPPPLLPAGLQPHRHPGLSRLTQDHRASISARAA